MSQSLSKEVLQANVELHTKLAQTYSSTEPHFRPENIRRVEEKLKQLARTTQAKKLLDLGCGTGFMIQIAKKMIQQIDGVDITQAMLDQVDLTGSAKIRLFNEDTSHFKPDESTYDLVTSYSFLHHLYDIKDTCQTAFKALKPGGVYYVDLEPNFYFWKEIKNLSSQQKYDPIIQREIQSVSHRDDEIQEAYGVSQEIFNHAEYSKNIRGGFKAEYLDELLKGVGFRKVEIFYNWFVGQGTLIHDKQYKEEEGSLIAHAMESYLLKALPVSKGLFKYLGFYAEK